MPDTVHYLPIGLGTEQLVRPLVRGGLPVDRAVLLVPADGGDHSRMVTGTEKKLRETVGLDVEISPVETNELASVVAAGYDDLLDDLSKGRDVYINVASPYWSLGAGYATAAHYVIAETEQAAEDTDGPDIPQPRDRVNLYYTEPEGYRVEELLEASQRILEFRGDFADVWGVASDLQDDVESDRRTIRSVVELLDGQEGGLQDLVSVFEAVDETSVDDDGVARGIEQVVSGIEAVTHGIDILAREENREAIDSLPFLGPMTDVTQGLADVSDRPTNESGEVKPVDLLRYFTQRLDNVYEVLQRIEYLHEDFEGTFEWSTGDFEDLLSDVRSHGIAYGARSYEGEPYAESPGPLQFGLSPLQQAMLYTLSETGDVDSIRGFTIRLLQHALKVAAESDLTVPDTTGIDAIRNGEFGAATELLDSCLLPAIQSKVQYHLAQLETDGFIRKERFGQSTGLEFTRAGSMYVGTQEFDQQWRVTVFEDVCDIITDACNSCEAV